MENPKVSIVIPIYNVAEFLTKCLESCINQTYGNIEIVAVNDGSPDNSGEIIDSFAAHDKRIIHVRKENGGIEKARETGTNVATGEYIMYLDGDDFIAYDAVEKYIKTALEENADMVYSDFYNYYNDSKKTEITTDLKDRLSIKGVDYMAEAHTRIELWARIIKRNLCLNCQLQNLNIGEDLFALTQIVMRCKKIVYIKVPLYYYRLNPNSSMHRPNTVRNEIKHKLILFDFITRNNYPRKVVKKIIMTNIPIASKYCNDYDNPITAGARKDMIKLARLSLKYHPGIIFNNISNKRFKGTILFYMIYLFPWAAPLIHKNNKLRGKKNYEF